MRFRFPVVAIAGALSVGAAAAILPEDAGWAAVAGLGFRGVVLGAVFAAHYFGRGRWLLQFPVVQVSGLGEFRVSHISNCFEFSRIEDVL